MSLANGLQIGLSSLNSMEAAISVSGENIANVNTPNYSRKRVVLEESFTSRSATILALGTRVDTVNSIRDAFADRRILNEIQEMAKLEGQEPMFSQLEETLYASQGGGLSGRLSALFNSFSELATDPSSAELRQVSLAQAERLAQETNVVAGQLALTQAENRREIESTVQEINELFKELSDVQAQLAPLLAAGKSEGALVDRRQQLLHDLSEHLDIKVYPNEDGLATIASPNGTLYVSGAEAYPISVVEESSGMRVFSGNREITGEIHAGKLGGLLEMDREVIVEYQDRLDSFAGELADQFNAIHATGQSLDGSTGLALFTYTPGNAAASLAVAITDPDQLATGAVGAGPGDGSVAQQLTDLRDQSLAGLGDASLLEYFGETVGQIGLDAGFVRNGIEVQQGILRNLQDQQESIAGVSLDEEMVSLLEFQRNYQASSRFISIIDRLLQDTINLIQ